MAQYLYVESLEESLKAVQENVTKQTTTLRPPLPAAKDQLTLLQSELNSQRKQFEIIMEQNSKFLISLYKGDGFGGFCGRGRGRGRGRGSNGSGGTSDGCCVRGGGRSSDGRGHQCTLFRKGKNCAVFPS
jgi:hypothetical protein